MRIAVNTRFLLENRLEGIGRFTAEILQRMCPAHLNDEFVFLFDRPYAKDFIYSDNVTPKVLSPPARHPILWKWWFERSVPKALKAIKPDLFFSTDGFLSLRATTRTLLVMHDLAFEHYPENVKRSAARYYRKYCPLYAQHADHIIAVSEFTKQDIVARYNVPAEKISVVYNGVNDLFKPVDAETKDQVKAQFAEGADYFLFVSALQPRKNLPRLLEAFDLFQRQSNARMKLLVAGAHTWAQNEIAQKLRVMQFSDDVIFLGHLSQQQLAHVTAGALALAYVSLFEGFGIPIAEALNTDTPVITSQTSSMPEVAGEAAVLVDPLSVNSIAEALHTVAASEELRQRLITLGRTQREKFSWDASAQQVWEIISSMSD